MSADAQKKKKGLKNISALLNQGCIVSLINPIKIFENAEDESLECSDNLNVTFG